MYLLDFLLNLILKSIDIMSFWDIIVLIKTRRKNENYENFNGNNKKSKY